jgi:hypothetical protein
MHPDILAAVLAAIRAEVENDPTGRGYEGQTAAEIATRLNAPIVTAAPPAYRDVSISDVEGYLRARLLVTQLRTWAATAEPGTAKMAALEMLDIIASPRLTNFTTGTEAGRANVLGLFAVLVAATGGIVTQTHLDELTAMTLSPASPAVEMAPRWSMVIEGQPGAPNVATAEFVAEALA